MPLKLNTLFEEAASRSMTQNFLGLNKNLRSGDGEFFDMFNLTSDHAPVLSTRERRYVPTGWEASKPTDVIAGVGSVAGGITDGVCWIDGTNLHLGSQPVELGAYDFVADRPSRTVVKMGAYLVIVPDMIYVKTVKRGEDKKPEAGKIEDRHEAVPVTNSMMYAMLQVVDYNGDDPDYRDIDTPKGTEDEPLANGALWHKPTQISGDEYAPGLYRYDESKGEWYAVKSYLKLSFDYILQQMLRVVYDPIETKVPLRAGDAIVISNLSDDLNGKHVIAGVSYEPGDETKARYIWFEGFINENLRSVNSLSNAPVTIERYIPSMDYVCEAGNRLWGCKYGEDDYGNFVNEIYCSARGDFYRWGLGEATNDDAPVTFSVGVDGSWTGCVNYGGYPTFFKENHMLRVSGYGASGFALQDAPCAGVARGAARSLAVVNNVLYYKSSAAVMAYDGSTPVSVSNKLGRLSRYNNAVGGACANKYYLSMWVTDAAGKVTDPVLLALDTERGLWHKEDNTECESMSSNGENLYFVEVNRRTDPEKRTIKAVHVPDLVGGLPVESKDMEPDMISWYAETGVIGLESPDAKYVGRIAIRMHLDTGATVRLLVQYDSSGYWKQIAATEAPTMKTVTMPVVPARCDHMRLRLEGVGGCKVYSITRTIENGEGA